ncbi:MAG: RNA polymerase sigma factor [Firmicutes bacterium]|nr:RNA polymerase sigma factor [Bacillota bacterium]
MVQLYLALIDDEEDQLRFEEAYYKYKDLMHLVAKEILRDEHRAEDAVQEAFIRIAKKFHKVGNVNDGRTKNFFIMITRRISLNMLQREEIFTTATEDELDYFENTAFQEDEPLSPYESELAQAIVCLPENLRTVLYLQAVCGFDGKETAGLLGISVDAVWKRTSRARTMLKKELGEALRENGDVMI